MARYLVIDAVFFLLPFALYAVWLLLSRGSARNADDWEVRTVTYLALAGSALLLLAIFAFTSFTRQPAEGVYVPAHIENGVVVPGRIEPAPK